MATGRTQNLNKIALRPASAHDADIIFGWRNDPFILVRGSSQRPVNWNEHVGWFMASLADHEHRLLLVIEYFGVPVGLVRFDKTGAETATISVYLTERYTSRGFGVMAISKGCAAARDILGVTHVLACIRDDNSAAITAFTRAGFAQATRSCPSGHKAFLCEF